MVPYYSKPFTDYRRKTGIDFSPAPLLSALKNLKQQSAQLSLKLSTTSPIL
jgi:hypothetical protein